MAGTKGWYLYRTDGNLYCAMEQSDVFAAYAGNPPANADSYQPPRGLDLRYAPYRENLGTRERRITLWYPTAFAVLPPTISETIDGKVVVFNRGSLVPERARKSPK